MEALELAAVLRERCGVPAYVRSSGEVLATSGGGYSSVLVFDQFVVKTWIDLAYSDWLRFVMAADKGKPYYEHLPRVIWADLDLHIAILERLHDTYSCELPSLFSDFCAVRSGRPEKCEIRWAAALFQDMRAAGLFSRHREDLHSGNRMFRYDGRRKVIVVTDPIAPEAP